MFTKELSLTYVLIQFQVSYEYDVRVNVAAIVLESTLPFFTMYMITNDT